MRKWPDACQRNVSVLLRRRLVHLVVGIGKCLHAEARGVERSLLCRETLNAGKVDRAILSPSRRHLGDDTRSPFGMAMKTFVIEGVELVLRALVNHQGMLVEEVGDPQDELADSGDEGMLERH